MRAKVIPTPTISRIIKYKTLRSVIFVILIYNSIFLVWSNFALQEEKSKRKTNKTIFCKCPPWNRPWFSGSKVWHAKHKVTMSSCVPLEITEHNLSIRHIPICIHDISPSVKQKILQCNIYLINPSLSSPPATLSTITCNKIFAVVTHL